MVVISHKSNTYNAHRNVLPTTHCRVSLRHRGLAISGINTYLKQRFLCNAVKRASHERLATRPPTRAPRRLGSPLWLRRSWLWFRWAPTNGPTHVPARNMIGDAKLFGIMPHSSTAFPPSGQGLKFTIVPDFQFISKDYCISECLILNHFLKMFKVNFTFSSSF